MKKNKTNNRNNILRAALSLMLSVTIIVTAGAPAFAASPFRYSTMQLLKKNGKTFDLRVEAKQKLYGYDTLQGACAYKGFGYFALFNRDVEKCKIVKVRLSDLKVVKVSKALPVQHANNLTYNSKKKLLMATCCRPNKDRVVFINPKTLRYVSRKDIKLKSSKKIPQSVVNKYKGFTAITYNAKHDRYIGRLRGSNDVIIFSGKLKPLKYVKMKGNNNEMLKQGMESVGDYIYDVRSFKGKYNYNMVTIHTMSGKYVGKMKFSRGSLPGKELECIFHDGSQFYAGFYFSTSQKNDTKENKVKRYSYIYKLN